MKKRIFKKPLYYGGFVFIMISFAMVLMSTKDRPQPDGDSTPCESLAGDDARIRINVDPFGSSANFFRNDGFQDFVPSQNDLRVLDGDPAGFLSQEDRYYCIVTVTSPQCADWVWEAALSNDNRDNDIMDIRVPPEGFDTRINVVYYEIADFPVTGTDFNRPGLLGEGGVRVIYEATETFLGAPGLLGNPPEPINLFATDTDVEGIEICEFFCDGDYDIGKGIMGDVLEDYGSINTLINNR